MAEEIKLRVCSMCAKVYGPDYADTFCVCGFELTAAPGSSAAVAPPVAALAPQVSSSAQPAGKRCLVLYGPDKQPVRHFPLTKDITLIGRQDPVEGAFPDIDVTQWLDAASARQVSRQHAMVLRSRAQDVYSLRPLPGNTGTQLEKDMLPAGQDFPLSPGNRMILGGVVRFKFEIT